jgi:hypothetical protein
MFDSRAVLTLTVKLRPLLSVLTCYVLGKWFMEELLHVLGPIYINRALILVNRLHLNVASASTASGLPGVVLFLAILSWLVRIWQFQYEIIMNPFCAVEHYELYLSHLNYWCPNSRRQKYVSSRGFVQLE